MKWLILDYEIDLKFHDNEKQKTGKIN